jgi:alkaline phosphatase isozyme conversion protein
MKKVITRLAIITLISFFVISCGDSGTNDSSQSVDPVVRSMAHMEYLSDEIGPRVTGTAGVSQALNYIRAEFLAMGYQPEIQPFSVWNGAGNLSSSNIIAVLKGKSNREIVVGAHYDSVAVGRGYVDNASGAGLMLAIAERLKRSDPPFTIRFIAFGAEEIGLVGSRYYTANMSGIEIANTIGMIDLDTVVGGDMIYAYGGPDEQGWMRDQALDIAKKLQIGLQTNPGLNPAYPQGTTGDWSDHAPFRELGIDYLYFEATNWEIGDRTGFMQTVKFGEIYHTANDTFAFLDREYPGRVESQLEDFAMVLEEFLLNVNPPDLSSRSILRDQTGKRTIPIRYMHRDGSPIDDLPHFGRRP